MNIHCWFETSQIISPRLWAVNFICGAFHWIRVFGWDVISVSWVCNFSRWNGPLRRMLNSHRNMVIFLSSPLRFTDLFVVAIILHRFIVMTMWCVLIPISANSSCLLFWNVDLPIHILLSFHKNFRWRSSPFSKVQWKYFEVFVILLNL